MLRAKSAVKRRSRGESGREKINYLARSRDTRAGFHAAIGYSVGYKFAAVSVALLPRDNGGPARNERTR